jgi:hypothetical protein
MNQNFTMYNQHKARLLNCLQTILDMDTQLRSLRTAGPLAAELTSLRAIIQNLNLDQIPLHETDVQRIESATSSFLQELEVFYNHDHQDNGHHGFLH